MTPVPTRSATVNDSPGAMPTHLRLNSSTCGLWGTPGYFSIGLASQLETRRETPLPGSKRWDIPAERALLMTEILLRPGAALASWPPSSGASALERSCALGLDLSRGFSHPPATSHCDSAFEIRRNLDDGSPGALD